MRANPKTRNDMHQNHRGELRHIEDDLAFFVQSGLIARGEGAVDHAHRLDGPPPQVKEAAVSYTEDAPQLQISMTDACNMACSYCAFRAREGDGKPVNMAMTRALRAIDVFREQVGEEVLAARIDFGLAGEPMLRHKTHGTLIEHIREVFRDRPDMVVWAGTNTTNGTLFTRPEAVGEIAPPMDISLDGPEHVHNRFRKYVNGKGTFDDVVAVAKATLRKYPGIGCSAVLTAAHTDFVEIFRFLHEELGFRDIYMKPVNAERHVPYGLNRATLPAFQQGYTELVQYLMGLDSERKLAALMTLNREDYFMRFFYRVKERAHEVYRCGAGKTGMFVDTNGKLYACAHFIGKAGWHIGTLEEGVEERHRRRYLEMRVDNREPCRSCWARYLCGGGCHYQAVLANGDIDRPDEVKCDLIRHLSELAIRLVTHLAEEDPAVLSALPSPYLVPHRMLHRPPDASYLPSARAVAVGARDEGQRVGDAVLISAPARVEGRLPDGIGDVHLAGGLEGGELRIEVRSPAGTAGTLLLTLTDLGRTRFRMADLRLHRRATRGTVLRVELGGSGVSERCVSRQTTLEPAPVRQIPFRPETWEKVPGATVREPTPGTVEIVIPVAPILGRARWRRLGLNAQVEMPGGGRLVLVRHEPFCVIDQSIDGPFRIEGGEFEGDARPPSLLNASPIAGFEPVTRWSGVRSNTC